MAPHQTTCHWALELLEAAVIFIAGIILATLAVVAFRKTHNDIAILFLGAVTTILFFVISCRVCSAALRKRRALALGIDYADYEEGGGLPQVATRAPQRDHRQGGISLPADKLAQLPRNKADCIGDGVGEEDCAVCLGQMGRDGLETTQLPACKHVFHKHCVDQWLREHTTCPICRRNARQVPVEAILKMNLLMSRVEV
ncbi:hypothetical protein ACP4OV_012933 [Aristida adscensionis]